VAAAIGQPLHIPVIVRSLGQDMYRVGPTPDGMFRPGLELMAYLDGNLSSNGLDDPALGIQEFYLPWWTRDHAPTGNSSFLCSATINSAVNHYRQRLEAAMMSFIVPHSISSLANELNKPAYTWHSSANDDLPNSPNDCTRCRLYRAVAVGVMDQLRDTYNMVHGCEIANEAEKAMAIRRASGFNELFEAALKKECDRESGSGSGSKERAEKDGFAPEVERLKELMKDLALKGAAASSKWTWGVDLTEDDLRGLIRGADRQDEGPHSGYDQDLPSVSLQSQTSEALDPANLEDPNDGLHFDNLSDSITLIPDLPPLEFPTYAGVLSAPTGNEPAESEPDPVIEAFTKGAKTQATKAKKLLMQDEVDRPVSYLDYGSEFVSRNALIPRRPWLAPRLPEIAPPTNAPTTNMFCFPTPTNNIMPTDSHADDDYPDHIDISESDSVPDSGDNPASHRLLESPSSDIYFPLSDESSHSMDVVRSDMEIPMSENDTDSESECSIPSRIVWSESPMSTRQSIGGSGVMERDANTGRFTAASFANFSDELLD
jgi:hypothetical protein